MLNRDSIQSSLRRQFGLQHDDGVTPLRQLELELSPAPVRYRDEALTHWNGHGKDEYAAGRALSALGLESPAEPHMKKAQQAAAEALSIYFQNTPALKELPKDADAAERKIWNTLATANPLSPPDFAELIST